MTENVIELRPPEQRELYRDATFSADTRARLGLAIRVLAGLPDLDAQLALEGVRDVVERWDENVATEVLL